MATEGLRFAVLGGPRVWRDGAELDLGPPQRRQLLTLLMLSAGDAVGIDAIVGVLWGYDPPGSALNVVYRHVGQLRRLLEPELTSRQPGSYVSAAGTGYRLQVPPGGLDLIELRSLLAAADATSAARLVELAADRAGARLPPNPGLDALLTTVESDRVAAAVTAGRIAFERADTALARTVLPSMQRIAHDHPFDEPLQAALVRVLVSAGRRADALAHFGTVRALMDEELGIEPGPDLRGAQRDALAGDPGPASEQPRATARRPAQLPIHVVRVVGRESELAALVQRLRKPGHGSVVCALTGMGGIGKTTVAQECARRMAEEYPDGQLYANLHGYDDTLGPAEPADVLRSFLVALGAEETELPRSAEDRAALFRSLVADQRLLILLDNARDSAQVAPLLPGGRGCAVLVTSRHRLDELAAAGALVVPLNRLSTWAGVELLGSRVGDARVTAEPAAAAALVEAGGGHPLALSLLAARAARYRDGTLSDLLAGWGGPGAALDSLSGSAATTDLRHVLSLSYETLSDSAAGLFRCLGVHPGRGLSLPVTASLGGLDTAAARTAADELAAASLLTEVAPSRFEIHDLLHAYAAELAGPEQSDAAGRRLVSHYVGSLRNAYLQFGRPAIVPLPGGPADVTPEQFHRSAEAMAWYLRERSVLQVLVGQAADLGLAAESALLVLDARPMSQYWNAAHELAPLTRRALDAVLGSADEPTLEAELHRDLGMMLYRSGQQALGRHELAVALTQFEALGDRVGEGNTLRNLVRTAFYDGDNGSAVVYAERAVQAARASGDPITYTVQLGALAEALLNADRPAEAAALSEQAIELSRRHGLVNEEPGFVNALVNAQAAMGNFGRAVELLQLSRELYARQGLVAGTIVTWQALFEAECHFNDGEREAALALYRRYLDLSRSHPVTVATGGFRPSDAALGDVERIRARIAELEAVPADEPPARYVSASRGDSTVAEQHT